MKLETSNNVGNLPTFGARLQKIELEHVQNDDGSAVDAREDLVDALPKYRLSRFEFGKLLSAYKAFFIEDRGWLTAVAVIADELGCDERTVRRIVEDYERVSQLPAVAIEELVAQGIDPAAKRNAAIVSSLPPLLSTAARSEAKEAIDAALAKAREATARKRTEAAKSPGAVIRPAGETESALFSGEEKQRIDLRQRIRGGLTNVANGRKFFELIAAIEEVMYEWGERKVRTVSFTPRASAVAIDAQ